MNPITTIIQNNTSNSRFANWTGSVKTWLPAGGVAEVPFEVWSVGDKKQHDALVAELKAGLVTLSIRILKPNGNYETIPFNPIADILPQAPVQQIAEPKPSPTESKTEETVHSNKHIVIAGDKSMSDVAKHFHLKAESVVQPGEQDVADDIKDTVEFSNKVLQEDRIAEEKKEETPVEPEDIMFSEEEIKAEDERFDKLMKEANEDTQEEVKSVDLEQLEKEINELLAAKAYEEVHKILVEVFGEEKITFKASALKNTKTYAAIVKKYKL